MASFENDSSNPQAPSSAKLTAIEAEYRSRPTPPSNLSRWECRSLVIFGIAILGLLLVTRFLQPDPSGMGTHQKLGLLPCGSIAMFGVPCPSCGMTTSWAWLTRGQLQHSWNANPGGLALGFFVLIMGPWMLISGLKGRWWPIECQPFYVLYGGLLVIGITAIQWLVRIL